MISGRLVVIAGLIAISASNKVAGGVVPLDQDGFQNYFARRISPYVNSDPISFDTPYLMRVTSPMNHQWIEFPLTRVHDGCVENPTRCDDDVEIFLRKLVSMLPQAIAARDRRPQHDNSLEVMRYGGSDADEVLPPSSPVAGQEDIPSDKDDFTKYYAAALAKGLPDYGISVAATLRISIKPPVGAVEVDDIVGLYGLCSRDHFQCADGLATYLKLDLARRLKQM